MAGKKGSSPNVYKYYKIDGDRIRSKVKEMKKNNELTIFQI